MANNIYIGKLCFGYSTADLDFNFLSAYKVLSLEVRAFLNMLSTWLFPLTRSIQYQIRNCLNFGTLNKMSVKETEPVFVELKVKKFLNSK